jgi:hypothetical protein
MVARGFEAGQHKSLLEGHAVTHLSTPTYWYTSDHESSTRHARYSFAMARQSIYLGARVNWPMVRPDVHHCTYNLRNEENMAEA